MRHTFLATIVAICTLSGCSLEEATRANDPKFPLATHPLLPQYYGGEGSQIAAGSARFAGRDEMVLDQPIMFSHNLHATDLKIDCQFCHSEARKSIHGGVPPVQTCMNCHRYVKTDQPEIKKIHQYYCGKDLCGPDEQGQNGKPIPWNKVHDLPDYVNFNHSRHVKAGVDCTECHGQVRLQGERRKVVGADGTETFVVDKVMVRETSLQMGWCLDCHRSHPSVDANYGDMADLRRAELKDCWTCHK